MSQPTPNQRLAIETRGQVLVEAGAGSGKTHTLVQRCLARILDPCNPVSLDRILMVTFTEAAAAEMRKRIAGELARIRHAPGILSPAWPNAGALDLWMEEQTALIDQARISTLHSFCLELIREHFHELGLDPSLQIMDEPQAAMLAGETLSTLLDRNYEDPAPFGEAVRNLIHTQGNGNDAPIMELVLRVHRYMRSLDDPRGWLTGQTAHFEAARPQAWRAQLLEELACWRRDWMTTLRGAPGENLHAARCLKLLESFDPNTPDAGVVAFMQSILAVRDSDWKRRKGKDEPILRTLFKDAAFLLPLFLPSTDRQDPIDPVAAGLDEDWAWVRGPMGTLLGLVRAFDEAYAEAKRERGMLDFADLEQFALKILWNPDSGKARSAASEWQERLDLVFVDEYQDINAAQNRILSCVSRDGERANRFLVGDVKQSIYRFRLANPRIFQGYATRWRQADAEGMVIALAENFRSHQAILEYINRLFSGLMKPSVGGVSYDEDARLKFGNAEGRPAMAMAVKGEEEISQPARVEFLLRVSTRAQAPGSGENEESLTSTEAEARMIGARLKALKECGFEIVEDGRSTLRKVEWRDMVVLLRSPGTRAETYAREFARLGLPLEVSCGGFYDRPEISDLISLLSILDNPLQDIPLLAVLRSPWVGLTLNELAVVRLALRKGHYWEALRKFHTNPGDFETTFLDHPAVLEAARRARPRISAFLNQYRRWRHLARQGSLANCLESVLAETLYEAWLKGLPRGDQSAANVRRFCATARRFDQFQRQGLYRFLNYIRETQEAGAKDDVAPAPDTDAIRLMSIHNSKGQEFPIVVVAGLRSRFNTQDLEKGVILDETLGLCPMVHPPGRASHYPSPGRWMARRRQQRELLGEEIRLLYVALTRAKDKLLLAATVSENDLEHFAACTCHELEDGTIAEASSMADWVGALIGGVIGFPGWCHQEAGRAGWFSWSIQRETAPAQDDIPTKTSMLEQQTVDSAQVEAIARRLSWAYPHAAATALPAKTTVTEARRRLADIDDDVARPFQPRWPQRSSSASKSPSGGQLTAAETGIAHHTFLEHVDLGSTGSVEALRSEMERLVANGRLATEQAVVVDLEALADFWQTEAGRAIREHASSVHREMPFTARFTPAESGLDASTDEDEFVVVQGVVDLVVVLDEEVWIVDFKTDAVTAQEIELKQQAYKPQLRLYSKALQRLLGRPVTKAWLHFLSARQTCELHDELE